MLPLLPKLYTTHGSRMRRTPHVNFHPSVYFLDSWCFRVV